jgi:hypothetical protein
MTDGCVQLEIPVNSWVAPVRATGTVGRKSQAVRPVHLVQNHTCWATLLQPARRAAVLGQPSSLRVLIGIVQYYCTYSTLCTILLSAASARPRENLLGMAISVLLTIKPSTKLLRTWVFFLKRGGQR